MNTILVFACLLCISVVSGLQCYQCQSQKSLEDCDSRRIKKTCDAGKDRCGTIDALINVPDQSQETYAKGCATQDFCNNIDLQFAVCRQAKEQGYDVKCVIKCCSDNFCNGVTAPVSGVAVPLVSVFMLLACTLFAFIN